MKLIPNDLLRFESEITLSTEESIRVRLDKYKPAYTSALTEVAEIRPIMGRWNKSSDGVQIVSDTSQTDLNKRIGYRIVESCLIDTDMADLFPFQVFEIFEGLNELFMVRQNLLVEYAQRQIGLMPSHIKHMNSLIKKHIKKSKSDPNLTDLYSLVTQGLKIGIKPSDLESMQDEDLVFMIAAQTADSYSELIRLDEQIRRQEMESRKQNVMSKGSLPTFSGTGR